MARSVVCTITDSSQVGEARRIAARFGSEAGLGEQQNGKLAIVVTELANNLQRYAQHGQLLLQEVPAGQDRTIEIVAIDSGPGMADVNRCLRDGFSSGGTPGNGLGAVKRLSSEFEIFSTQPGGTVVLSRIAGGSSTSGSRAPGIAWGAVSLCAQGESVCGDAWRLSERDGGFAILIADGLGHGPLAGEAADAVVRAFESDPFAGPKRVVEAGHREASGSRGVAVASAELDFTSGVLRYAGVGNISGTLLSASQSRGLASHGGIVGVQVRKTQEFEYIWPEGGLLVMHSDGLRSRWSLDGYPGLARRHPGVVAAVLARDFRRGRDDLTIVAVRIQA